MKRCFFYPGQGAQFPGMAQDLWNESESVQRLFDVASAATEMDCRRVLFDASEEELKATNVAQVAIVLANKAASVVLAERGISADGCAGFSLGEYSALNDGGVLADADLFSIIAARGAIMERCSRAQDTPAGRSGMAAVVGLEYDEVVAVLEGMKAKSASAIAYPGLHNASTQIVISGTAEALQAGEGAFDEAGAMNYVVLKTSGPFHSPLMQEAKAEFAARIEPYEFCAPTKPIYSNVTGSQIEGGAQAKKLCAEQLVSTVRWVEVLMNVQQDGYEQYLEVGPGKVLAGLWKRFTREVKCTPAGNLEQITALEGA